MIINDLDVDGTVLGPNEADPILVVYSDAVLPAAVAFECLEPVARRHFQIVQCDGRIDLVQLSECNTPEIGRQQPPSHRRPDAVKDIFRGGIGERLDHPISL